MACAPLAFSLLDGWRLYKNVVMEFRSNRNVLFSCKNHVVFYPKYRKCVLNPPIDKQLKRLIEQVCLETASDIIEMGVMPDHFHLLVGRDPQYGIHRLVKGIKGRSSRILRQEFSILRTRLPTLWTNSDFISSVGGAPLAVIKRIQVSSNY